MPFFAGTCGAWHNLDMGGRRGAAPPNTLIDGQAWQAIAQSLKLSAREIQIAQLVLDDVKEASIARRLAISPHTVHTHLERLYHKLSVASRVELVVRLASHRLELSADPDATVPPVRRDHTAGRRPLADRQPSS